MDEIKNLVKEELSADSGNASDLIEVVAFWQRDGNEDDVYRTTLLWVDSGNNRESLVRAGRLFLGWWAIFPDGCPGWYNLAGVEIVRPAV